MPFTKDGAPGGNSFMSAVNMRGTRNYGSSITTLAAEPYTTGTFYIWFGNLPNLLPQTLADGLGVGNVSGLGETEDQIQKILSALCTGVTPPGGTLNPVEYTGLGGVRWGVPGSIDYGRTITLKFIELKDLPILTIIGSWFKMIRDNRTGISLNVDITQYDSSIYGGTLLYWTTTPNGKEIQFFAGYDGIFPLKDPMDAYSSDVETIDKQEVEIEFNVNRIFRDAWVLNECVTRNAEMFLTHQQVLLSFSKNRPMFGGSSTNPPSNNSSTTPMKTLSTITNWAEGIVGLGGP
jgi:hypothetical protein